MKIPIYIDTKQFADAMSGISIVEKIRNEERVKLNRLLHSHQQFTRAYKHLAKASSLGEAGISKMQKSLKSAAEGALAEGYGRPTSIVETTNAVEGARVAGYLQLPDILEQYRPSDAVLASRFLAAYRKPWWSDSYLEALNSHAALSNMLDRPQIVGHEMLTAIESAMSKASFWLDSQHHTRLLLQHSGLLRLPRFRRLTSAEREQEVKRRLKASTPPPQVRKAHSLIHRYELVLRDVITQSMEEEYGEDWAIQRLPECNCKTLLGRKCDAGERVLDLADFPHYAAIMSHPRHFKEVFSKGFESPETIESLISRVRALRKRSHHARTFTPENLRELTIVWRTIETGLIMLIDDVVCDGYQ